MENNMITKTYQMKSEDWNPIIDAMAYLKNLPQCGDVATELHKIFSEAQKGKYYFIEIGYEQMDGKCFVINQSFKTVSKDGDH